jgi:predicted Zn-dependent protease
MRKLTALLFTVCLFIQPAHIEGQSFENTGDDFTILDVYYLGRAVAANILSVYRPYTASPEVTQYLNLICQALVINSDHPPTFNGYHVTILDSNELNAFASPSGHIFITKRLIETVTSEDMLAAIIAHELAHVALRHSIAIINRTRLESELSAIADWAADTAAGFSDTARQAAEFRGSIIRTVDTLMRSGYSQTQEFEADLEAIVILSKAGYDPRALLELLRLLQRQGEPQRSGLNSTHPNSTLRIANIERFNYPNVTTGEYRTARFKNLKW